jgi:hypothetical protein
MSMQCREMSVHDIYCDHENDPCCRDPPHRRCLRGSCDCAMNDSPLMTVDVPMASGAWHYTLRLVHRAAIVHDAHLKHVGIAWSGRRRPRGVSLRPTVPPMALFWDRPIPIPAIMSPTSPRWALRALAVRTVPWTWRLK